MTNQDKLCCFILSSEMSYEKLELISSLVCIQVGDNLPPIQQGAMNNAASCVAIQMLGSKAINDGD
jgi:hypothetical protein